MVPDFWKNGNQEIMKHWIALLLLCGQVVAPMTWEECSSTHHPEPQAAAHQSGGGTHTRHAQVSSFEITTKPAHPHQHSSESPCIMAGSCATVAANVATVELAISFWSFALERGLPAHIYANPSLATNTPPPKAAA